MSYLNRVLTLLFIVFSFTIVDAKPLSVIKKDSFPKDILKDFTGIWLRFDFTERLIKYGSPRLANDFIPDIMTFSPCDKFVDSCVKVYTLSGGESIMGSERFYWNKDSVVFSRLVGYCYKMYFGTNIKELNCVLVGTYTSHEIKDTIIKYVKIGKVSCETQSSASNKLYRAINKTLFAGNWELLDLKTLEKQILVLDEEGKIQNWKKFDAYDPSTNTTSFACTDCNIDKLSELNNKIDLISFTNDKVAKEVWFGYKHNGSTIDFWNAFDDTQTIVYQLKRQ